MKITLKREFTDFGLQFIITYAIMVAIAVILFLIEYMNEISFFSILKIVSDSIFPTTITFVAGMLVDNKIYKGEKNRFFILFLLDMVMIILYVAYLIIIKDSNLNVNNNKTVFVIVALFVLNLTANFVSLSIFKDVFFKNCDRSSNISSSKKGMSINE